MDEKEIKEMPEGQEIQAEDSQKEYPPTKIVLPAIAAIWLAVFLVALAC